MANEVDTTLLDNLNSIKNSKADIKQALIDKGQNPTNVFADYAQLIKNIPSGSGGGDVKLFETIADMQADTDPQEGDLAIVYRDNPQPVQGDSEFSSCIFPNTVVLDEAFTGSIYGGFGATDQSVTFAAVVEVSSSRFSFSDYGESSNINVQYTSSDGITYTRTDGGEELVEFGTAIKWESFFGPFNSIIGNFMKIGENYFGGLYEYKSNEYVMTKNQLNATPDYVYEKTFYGKNGVENGTLGNPVVNTKDEAVIDVELYSKLSKLDLGNIGSNLSSFSNLFTNKLNVVYVPRFINTCNITDVSLMFSGCNNLLEIYEFDTANVTNMSGFFHFCSNLRNIPNFNTINVTDTSLMFCSCKNIIDLPDIDTTKVTNMSAMFDFCVNITAMPLYNTSNVTDFSYFARSCYNLVNIPIIDTSNAIYMRAMFANCWNLVDIPELDTHSVRSLTYMFQNCNNLSNSAIQNIVNMCLNCNITNSNYMNLNNTNSNSPLYGTKFNSMYYSNRLSELSSAGWSY